MACNSFAETAEVKNEALFSTGRGTAAAQILAYLAAAPLIIAALFIVAGDGRAAFYAAYLMSVYGAALIVFFGGVRWGVAVMKTGGPTMQLLCGAGLPLLAAIPLLLPLGDVT